MLAQDAHHGDGNGVYATEILIGTSGLSVNKHVDEYHKVLCVSITLRVSFERDGKSLKDLHLERVEG
jgi:hypothetical protein